MMIELKPCPFCGNDGTGPIEEALHIVSTELRHRVSAWSVQCDKCTATMGYSDNEDEAVAAWNTRADAALRREREPVEPVAWLTAHKPTGVLYTCRKASKENDYWSPPFPVYTTQPDALALVAAAYAAAAREVDCCGCNGNCHDPANCHQDYAKDILALIPADAEAHLTALLRAEYERGKAETQQSVGTTIKETIIGVLRHYRQNEVCDEYGEGYPLVDALTLEGHGIDMGIREIENIADAVADALLTQEGR